MSLGEAIKVAYGRTTQDDIAKRIGTTQPTVSKWVRGETDPNFDQVAAIEDACDRPRGFILRLAGYVVDPVGVLDAIDNDAEISEESRAMLRHLYEGARARARRPPP